jgi:hypothetical protein
MPRPRSPTDCLRLRKFTYLDTVSYKRNGLGRRRRRRRRRIYGDIRERKEYGDGENCTVRSFIVFAPH